MFYDHASGKLSVYHQTSLSAVETIKAKDAFEREATFCGISVKKYRTDNGIFTSKAYEESLDQGQYTDRSGVGAHHQNGVAEANIGCVQACATTLARQVFCRSLAFCSRLRHLHLQPCSNQGQAWDAFSHGSLLWNENWLSSSLLLACLWMPLLCSGSKTPRWQEDSQMGTLIPKGTVSRIFQGARHYHWHDLEYSYRTYQSTISCCFR